MKASHIPCAEIPNPQKLQRRVAYITKSGVPQNPTFGSCPELSALVEQLASFKPLRESSDLRNLAQKALDSLQNRRDENIEDWAAQIANDVAGAID